MVVLAKLTLTFIEIEFPSTSTLSRRIFHLTMNAILIIRIIIQILKLVRYWLMMIFIMGYLIPFTMRFYVSMISVMSRKMITI